MRSKRKTKMDEELIIGSKIIVLFGTSTATVLKVVEQHIKKTENSTEVDFTLVSQSNKKTTYKRLLEENAVIFKTFDELQKHLEKNAKLTIQNFVNNLRSANEEQKEQGNTGNDIKNEEDSSVRSDEQSKVGTEEKTDTK